MEVDGGYEEERSEQGAGLKTLARVLDPRALGAREVLLVAALLMLAAFAFYGRYVSDSGFFADDWANAAAYRFADPPRLASSIATFHDILGGRPVLAVALAVPHALFGTHAWAHLALGIALAWLVAVLLHVVLRVLGAAFAPAFVAALLTLVFPLSDATRLWATAAVNNLAVVLYLAGLLVALQGLRGRGRNALLLHACALLLYLLSMLTYEVAAPAILLSGLLYRVCVPWRSVIPRWLADGTLVAVAIAYSAAATGQVRRVTTVRGALQDVPSAARQAGTAVAQAFVPSGARPLLAVPLLLALFAAFGAVVLLRKGGADARCIRWWLMAQGIAAIGVGAAHVVLLGSYLGPLSTGIGNRGNVFAALPVAVFVCATVILAGLVVAHLLARPRLVMGVAGGLLVLILIGQSTVLLRHEDDYLAASQRQAAVLSSVRAGVPKPVPGALILTAGEDATVNDVPVFDETWDLAGAISLLYGDRTVSGLPVVGDTRIACTTAAVRIMSRHQFGGEIAAGRVVPFGVVYLVNVPTGRTVRITDAASCEGARALLPTAG